MNVFVISDLSKRRAGDTTIKGFVPFFLSGIVLVGLLNLLPALTLGLRRLPGGG